MNVRQQSASITEGIIWKQLLLFFFPILMGSFFQQMYNTVDTIIVGRALGTQALAAVGSSSSLINLINGFFIGLSSGATVILSQFYGAGDLTGLQRSLHTGITLSLVLGALTMLVGVALSPGILRLIQTPENCLADAVTYVQIYFLGAIASMVYNMGTGILRAMGDSKKPMLFLIISCVTNVLLDLLFVIVWDLGIAGVAIATVAAQCISAVLVITALLRLPQQMHLQWRLLRLEGPILRRILGIGIPAGLQFITYDLSNLITQSSINSFGAVTTAAWAAYAKSDPIIWMVLGAFGVAVTTFVGQNYGAGKYDRIRKNTRTCMAMAAAAVVLLCALEVYFRKWILGIYTTDPEVIRIGAFMMISVLPFVVLFVPVEVLGGTMRGVGYSLVPAMITGLFACAFRIGWVFLVVSRWHTVKVLILCYPISWLLCAVVFIAVYFRGHWIQMPQLTDETAYSGQMEQ